MRFWKRFVRWLAADEIHDAWLNGKFEGRNEARQMVPRCERCEMLEAAAMRNVYPDGGVRAYFGLSNAAGQRSEWQRGNW